MKDQYLNLTTPVEMELETTVKIAMQLRWENDGKYSEQTHIKDQLT